MLNKKVRKSKKVKMTKDHKKVLRVMFMIVASIVVIGFILSSLAWADIIPSGN